MHLKIDGPKATAQGRRIGNSLTAVFCLLLLYGQASFASVLSCTRRYSEVFVTPPVEEPAPTRDQVMFWYRSQGYGIPNPMIGKGSESFVFIAEKEGKRIAVKDFFSERPLTRDGASNVREQGRLASLVHKKDSQRASRAGSQAHRYFLETRVVEIPHPRLKGQTIPVLETEFFPRSPGSNESAPTLEACLEEGSLSPALKEKIMDQILEALTVMHSAQVIHRDLKPDNILVNDNGEIKIFDFGASVGLPDVAINRAWGTANYMGRAQFEKPHIARPENDLDSLRFILYELFQGHTRDSSRTFYRPFMISSETSKKRDFKHAPEDLTDPRLAIAIWSRWPKSIGEKKEGIDAARKMTENAFYKWYGKKLSQLPLSERKIPGSNETLKLAREAALDILGSKNLIERFPGGLALGSVRDEVILAVFQIRAEVGENVKDWERMPMFGPHPYLYFKEFRERLQTLQKNSLARPTEFYLKKLEAAFPYQSYE